MKSKKFKYDGRSRPTTDLYKENFDRIFCKKIKKNEVLTKDNIKIIRPGKGLHSKYFEKILGKRSNQNLNEGTPFKNRYLKIKKL